MKNLSGLTSKIRQWNSMGLGMLPTLQIAIIHSSTYDIEVLQFLKAFGPMELLYDEKKQPTKIISLTKKEENHKQQLPSEAKKMKIQPQEMQSRQIIAEENLQSSQKIQAQQIRSNQPEIPLEQSMPIKIKENSLIQHKDNPSIQSNRQALVEQNIIIENQNSSSDKKTVKQHQSFKAKETISIKKSLIKQWDTKISESIYAIYLTNEKIEARVHLIIDQQIGGKIVDQTLKQTKTIIQRLKRNKNIIILNFNTSIHKLDIMSDHIQLFGLSFKTKERQIKVDQLISKSNSHKSKHLHRNRTKLQPNYNKNVILTANLQSKGLSKDINIFQNTIENPGLKITGQHPKVNPLVKNQTKLLISQKIDPSFQTNVRNTLNSLFDQNPINLTEVLVNQIEKKYLNIFGVDINRNFTEMKAYHKQISHELKRYEEIMRFIEKQNDHCVDESSSVDLNNVDHYDSLKNGQKQKNLASYGFHCLHKAKQYLVSSLWGTYSNIKVYRQSNNSGRYKNKAKFAIADRRSLHWQIMQIMNQIWDIEGDFLMKQLDKMPLSYIQERYKMLDYQTIGGFMPSSCFQAIFAGPLKKMVHHIMETLQIVQMKIVNQVKTVLKYFFAMTNLSEDIADIQSEEIKKICQKFRLQTEKILKSQIEFISVSHEDFWSFKQIKSSLYGPQQQAYIEIKYIGKNYTKKVFDNIRQTLPRLIGQNLLRQIVSWLDSRSVQILMALLLQKRLQIQISEREKDFIQAMKINQKKVDQLVYFFSLKTSSETGVKHLHKNMQKNWNRMFKNPIKSPIMQQEQLEAERKGGFFEWARNLLKRNHQNEKKRSSSQQKQNTINQPKLTQNTQMVQAKKHQALTEKNWLLIINIEKAVEEQKIKRSSEEGFPERLRPSIWLYLAKRQVSSKLKKVQTFLNEGANVPSNEQKVQLVDIYKQIDKDVNRTPPPNLFRKGYLKDTLTRVLQAYSIYDKELRYTQGMNFIVAIILCVLTHHGENCEYVEEKLKSKAFFQVLQNQCLIIFMYIMEKKGLRKIMFIERATITDLCVRLEDYIKNKSPKMHQKIDRSGFNVEIIFSGALISGLTTSEIEFELQKRVIDMLLAHEFNVLYKIIGQFVAMAESLCVNKENESLYYFLKGSVYNEVYKQIGEDGLAQMFHNL